MWIHRNLNPLPFKFINICLFGQKLCSDSVVHVSEITNRKQNLQAQKTSTLMRAQKFVDVLFDCDTNIRSQKIYIYQRSLAHKQWMLISYCKIIPRKRIFDLHRINVGPGQTLQSIFTKHFSIEFRSVIKSALSHPNLFAHNVMAKITIITKWNRMWFLKRPAYVDKATDKTESFLFLVV